MYFKKNFLNKENLPHYLVLGLPNSGKSSLMNHLLGNTCSDQPIYFSQIEVGVVWKNDQAYFIELYGKTLNLKELDQILRFIIKQYGFLKGILLIVSGPDIAMEQEEGYHHDTFQPLNKALYLLSDVLHSACPLYFVLSCLDKLAGFQYFCERDTKTLALSLSSVNEEASDILSRCQAYIKALYYQLELSIVAKLQKIPDLSEKRFFQQFPSRLHHVHNAMYQWLSQLNQTADLEHILKIQGIYHTGYSSHHHKNHFFYDPIANNLVKHFPVPEDVLRNFFQTYTTFSRISKIQSVYCSGEALRLALFDDSVSLPKTIIHSSRKFWGLFIAVFLTFSIHTMTTLYFHYTSVVSKAKTVLHQQKQYIVTNHPTSKTFLLTDELKVVNQLNHSMNQLRSLRGFPVQYSILDAELQKVRKSILYNRVYPLIQSQIEDAFKKEEQPLKILYRLLKIWLLLNRTESNHADILIKELVPIIQSSLSEPISNLSHHLETFVCSDVFQRMKQQICSKQNRQVIQMIRKKVLEQSKEQIVLTKLENYFEKLTPSFPFAEKLPVEAQSVFHTNLLKLSCPAQYSAKYFPIIYEEMIPILVDTFLKGEDEISFHSTTRTENTEKFKQISQELIRNIRKSWLHRYADFWKESCNQLTCASIQDWNSVKALFTTFKKQTYFFQNFSNVIVQHTHWEFLHKNLKHWNEQDQHLVQSVLSTKFYSYSALFDLRWIASFGNLIHQLQSHFESILIAKDSKKIAFDFLKARFSNSAQTDAFDSILKEVATLPKPIDHWMQELIAHMDSLLFFGIKEHLNKLWYEEVFQFYESKIEKRYPFARRSNQDISLEDFVRFFGVQGKIIQYIEKYLLSFIETHNLLWQLKTHRGKHLSLEPSVLNELERAWLIRDVFFGTYQSLNLKFKIKIVKLPEHLKVFLHYGKRSHVIQSPFSNLSVIQWPEISVGALQEEDIKIIIQDGKGNESTHVFQGPWSWFRLLQQCSENQDKVPIECILHSKMGPISFQLWPEVNSELGFKKDILTRFTCPARIIV